MSGPSETTDTTSLRQALAKLRARLDRQEALVTEGFEALRAEIDSLDAQCRDLAQQATTASSLAEDVPAAPATPLQAAAQAEPVPDAPAAASAQPAAIPVTVVPGERAAEDVAAKQFDFAATPAVDKAAAHEFQFSAEPSAPAVTEPIHVTPVPAAGPATGDEIDMETVMFGPDLAANQSLFQDRSQLLQGLYSGEPAALTLLGQVLIFRGATPDRMPGLLKDIGEAYYRWRGHTAGVPDPFRDELTGWLQRKCEEAGVPNTIELVRPGDRYDSKRHHAKERGVEVATVRGWVVLRDNGRVYTKASVALK